MNSTLQGLLTLTPFIQEVYNQQQVWSSHPSSQILRCSTSTHTLTDHSLVSLLTLQFNVKQHKLKMSSFLLAFALSREFVDIAVCRFCNNRAEKKSVLAAFKQTVAEFNSEFDDNSQKVSTLFKLQVAKVVMIVEFENSEQH